MIWPWLNGPSIGRAAVAGERVALPSFDKLADKRLPPSRWHSAIGPVDLIVLEGWFLKVPAEAEDALLSPLNALERNEDADGRWRRHCNAALQRYASLWQRIDRLLWLRGPGFAEVPRWRWQQEQALQAKRPQHPGRSQAQIGRFVQFFERVSRQGERTLPLIADRNLSIDRARRPIGVLTRR